jgi:hypothetical protein
MEGFKMRLGAGCETTGEGTGDDGGRPRLKVVVTASAAEPGSVMLATVAERFALLNLMGQCTAHARRPGNADRARASALASATGLRSERRA